MKITLIALVAGLVGCVRYLKAKERSVYVRRVFDAYVINVAVIVGILAVSERALLLMLLPSFYSIAFLGFELNNAISNPKLHKEQLLFPAFTRTIFFFALFCGIFAIMAIK
jgi:hypothetical protein